MNQDSSLPLLNAERASSQETGLFIGPGRERGGISALQSRESSDLYFQLGCTQCLCWAGIAWLSLPLISPGVSGKTNRSTEAAALGAPDWRVECVLPLGLNDSPAWQGHQFPFLFVHCVCQFVSVSVSIYLNTSLILKQVSYWLVVTWAMRTRGRGFRLESVRECEWCVLEEFENFKLDCTQAETGTDELLWTRVRVHVVACVGLIGQAGMMPRWATQSSSVSGWMQPIFPLDFCSHSHLNLWCYASWLINQNIRFDFSLCKRCCCLFTKIWFNWHLWFANHIRQMEFKELDDWIPGCSRMSLPGVHPISEANPHAFWLLCASACTISLKDAHCAEISHYGLTWVSSMGPMTVSQTPLCQMPMWWWDTLLWVNVGIGYNARPWKK